jgi:hypothetical protein
MIRPVLPSRALLLAAALGAGALVAPTLAAAAPGYMTCQIFDGARNRVFYSNQPISADSGDVDEAYGVYLKAIIGSGLMGDPAKAQGNCNWEARKADAAQKGAAFVQHFVSAGANPFGDRYLSDPYVARRASAPGSTAAADAQVSSLPPKPNQTCVVSIKNATGEAQARMIFKRGELASEDLVFIAPLMEGPGRGPIDGTKVYAVISTSITTGAEKPTFDGIGVGVIFPDQHITQKLQIEVGAGQTTAIRDGVGPNPQGHYVAYQMAGGPLAGDPIVAALNKSGEVHLRVNVSGDHDKVLLFSNFDIGSPDDREALGVRAMDAVALKAKGAC